MKRCTPLYLWPVLFAMVAGNFLLQGCRPELPVLPIGGDVTLTAHTGRPYALFSEKQPAWIFFGFTTCPDVCPATLARLAAAEKILGRDIRTILISVDTTRDTPEVLRAYLSGYSFRHAIGLTGTKAELQEAARIFATFFDSTDPAAIVHQSRVFLIDSEGRLRHIFKGTEEPGELARISARVF